VYLHYVALKYSNCFCSLADCRDDLSDLIIALSVLRFDETVILFNAFVLFIMIALLHIYHLLFYCIFFFVDSVFVSIYVHLQ